MENQSLKKAEGIIKKLEKINNQTENKIDQLKLALVEYDTLQSQANLGGYQVSELIQAIDTAKTKRKNVSKKYIHGEFVRIKELALFRIKHNTSLLKFKSEKKA